MLITLLAGIFLYNEIFKQRQDQESMRNNIEIVYALEWIERLDLLYSDETFAKLGDLFETVEDELEHFVNHLHENNLFNALTQVRIEFPLTEHEALLDSGRSVSEYEWYRLVIYDGEIVTETSSDHLVDFFDYHYELLRMIKDLNEQSIISDVLLLNIGDRGEQINFEVGSEYTEFTERLVPHTRNTFIYVNGDITKDGIVRNIIGNWYMRIRQPFKLGDRPPPLED